MGARDKEYCAMCNHDIDLHVQNVRGKVRCLHVEHGESSRGVIGIPYQIPCECLDYKLSKEKEG